MRNFSGSDELHPSTEKELDKILTLHANSNPFLSSVRKDYKNYVEWLSVGTDKKKVLMESLENAIKLSG
ncbi:MAG: hypothetical protein H0V82_01020 [Candidatus Protochlamydia sp.]|nr:hypothetical protein [Candidatus Protochlamydia sp.]